MGVAMSIEKTLGLPPLKETLAGLYRLSTGERGERLERLATSLKELAHDAAGLSQAVEALSLLERLDREGTLTRLDRLLKDLKPLVESPVLASLLEHLKEFAPVLENLAKGEG